MKTEKISKAYYQGPKSDHFDGERFFNPWNPRGKKGFRDFLKWRMEKTRAVWPVSVKNAVRSPIPERSEAARATYIGHATILIQLCGLNILTDPLFSMRASPHASIGPRRIRPPFIPLETLPPIDVVFVSHNHYDHMDALSLRWLAKHHNPVFITPLGNDRLLRLWVGNSRILSIDWHDEVSLSNKVSLNLTPAQHWSRRGLYDINRALWGGCFLKTTDSQSVYFSGDTGFDESLFKDIHARHGAPDLALLPIGAYEPRWFMQYAHMNPADAVQAHKLLHARQSMGFHFGTFQMTNEAHEDPPRHLKEALIAENLPDTVFIAPEPGDFIVKDAV